MPFISFATALSLGTLIVFLAVPLLLISSSILYDCFYALVEQSILRNCAVSLRKIYQYDDRSKHGCEKKYSSRPPSSSFSNQYENNQNYTNISKVHMIFMTHLDVGYTASTVREVLEFYVTDHFPAAFNTSRWLRERRRRGEGEEQFVYTTHAWLLDALFVEM